VSPADDLEKARAHLAQGHLRRSLRAGWRAADAALSEGDAETLRALVGLSSAIEEQASGGVQTEAERLRSYCRSIVDGTGGVAESHAIVARISRIRQPRRTCPDCAEQVPAAARVCRYCGFRFDTA
jgi:hypothetical protein